MFVNNGGDKSFFFWNLTPYSENIYGKPIEAKKRDK